MIASLCKTSKLWLNFLRVKNFSFFTPPWPYTRLVNVSWFRLVKPTIHSTTTWTPKDRKEFFSDCFIWKFFLRRNFVIAKWLYNHVLTVILCPSEWYKKGWISSQGPSNFFRQACVPSQLPWHRDWVEQVSERWHYQTSGPPTLTWAQKY